MEKVTVQISKESFEFIRDLAKRIESQDSRATAKPYFFVIRTQKWRVAHDDYHSGNTKQVWVDMSGDADHSEWESPKAFMVDLVRHHGMTAKEAREYGEKHLEQFTMEEYHDEENCFLTEEAYKRHLELNSHNLGRRGQYHDYLKHAWRNPEMDGLFKIIAELGSAQI